MRLKTRRFTHSLNRQEGQESTVCLGCSIPRLRGMFATFGWPAPGAFSARGSEREATGFTCHVLQNRPTNLLRRLVTKVCNPDHIPFFPGTAKVARSREFGENHSRIGLKRFWRNLREKLLVRCLCSSHRRRRQYEVQSGVPDSVRTCTR